MASMGKDQLVFIHDHACSCSDCASENGHVQFWLDANGGGSLRNAGRRMMRNLAAMRMVFEPNSDSILRHISLQLTPNTAAVLAFQYGKLLARPLVSYKLQGDNLGQEYMNIVNASSLYHLSRNQKYSSLGWPFGLKTASRAIQTATNELTDGGSNSQGGGSAISSKALENSESSIVFSPTPAAEVPKSSLGWPLHQISVIKIQKLACISVEESATTSPERSLSASSCFSFEENSVGSTVTSNDCNWSTTAGLRTDIEKLLTTKSSDIKIFSYEELHHATTQFSSGNLVGKGGSSSVYKGCLPDGRLVAVKLFRFYKEACQDFFTEIDINASLTHKHIVPLVGVCLEMDWLIAIYDLLPQASLEDHLHGNKRKPGLAWGERFKVAVAVAEALSYLHDECPRPVIHRDVKSSNILFSSNFQPQLSDFGLAMWGPTPDTTQTVARDIFGTFGYIAPEYFMHGRVSDKIDVYSYGVVLLELLSGRRPVNLQAQKGEESIVKWAKQLINCGDLDTLLDPKLGDKLDAIQMKRMVSAASLCTSQTPESRPRMSQILKLLNGEIAIEELIKLRHHHLNEFSEEDEVWSSKAVNLPVATTKPKSRRRQSLADIWKETDTQHLQLKDYLKQEQ